MALVFILMVEVAPAQEAKFADGFKVLDHFVGNWRTAVTDKPSKFVPQGGNFTDLESTARAAQGPFHHWSSNAISRW